MVYGLLQLEEGMECKIIFKCDEMHVLAAALRWIWNAALPAPLISASIIKSILIFQIMKIKTVSIMSKVYQDSTWALGTRQTYWQWSHTTFSFLAATNYLSIIYYQGT